MTELSGAQQAKIADLQARITELRKDGVTAAERQEILSLTEQISKALSGTTVKGDMVGLTISKDGEHVNQTDAYVATPEQISAQEKYKDKAYIKSELCQVPTDPTTGQPLTKEQFEALVETKKAEYEAAAKELEDIEKTLADHKKYATLTKAQKNELRDRKKFLKNEVPRLNDEYQRLNVYYRAYVKGKGLGDIQGAAKNNVRYMTQVNDVVDVCLPGMKDETLARHPGVDPDRIKELSEKDVHTLQLMRDEASYIIDEARESLESGEITQEQFDEINAYYSNYLKMFDETPDGQEIPNATVIKNVLVDYSGLDHKFNLDETSDLAKEIGVKDGKIKSMVKKFGFGVEGTFWKRMGAAALAGGPALLANTLTKLFAGSNTVQAYEKRYEYKDYEFVDGFTEEQVTGAIIGGVDPTTGKPINTIIQETIVTPNIVNGKVEVTAEAFAKATAKIPWLNTLAGPIASGVLAFFLCDPKTENVFNGATVEAILGNGDLSKVKGDENKLLIANIQEMSITGNKVIDDRIKAAVVQTAIGKNTTAANTEELLAAYEALKDTKAKIQEIITQGVPTTETTSNTETTTTTPTDLTTPDIDEPTPPGPVTQEECHNTETMDLYTKVPIIKYGGPWHYTQLYVNEDGSELSAADRKALTKLLKDKNGEYGLRDVYENGRRTGRQLTTEITLPSGKVVKLADDAAARAAKISGNPGGTDIKYNTERNGSRMRAVDCKTGQPLTGWMTPSEFQQWEADRAK